MEESPYLEIKDPQGVIARKETKEEPIPEKESRETESTGKETPVKKADASLSYPAGTAEANPAEIPVEAGAAVSEALALDFTEESRMAWPVRGNVILGYSMDTTTYFPTLEQYKCNPANVIQSAVSTPVSAPADARVMEIGSNEEIGNFVRLDLGNDYTAVCGQLKEIPVVENEYLHKGDLIGYVAEPTKYYSVEGVNVYFELLHGTEPVDGLDYLE